MNRHRSLRKLSRTTKHVRIDGTNAPVTERQDLLVNATIENIGDVNDTGPISLSIDDTERDIRSVTIAGTNTETVSLRWSTEEGDAGSYEATVSSEDTTDTVSVTVDAIEPRVPDYTDDDGVVRTSGLRDAIGDWRNGAIDASLLRDVIPAWRSGEPIE